MSEKPIPPCEAADEEAFLRAGYVPAVRLDEAAARTRAAEEDASRGWAEVAELGEQLARARAALEAAEGRVREPEEDGHASWRERLLNEQRAKLLRSTVDFIKLINHVPASVPGTPPSPAQAGRDDCQFCLGAKGGMRGNENVVNGVVMCDYCTSLFTSASGLRTPAPAPRNLAAAPGGQTVVGPGGTVLTVEAMAEALHYVCENEVADDWQTVLYAVIERIELAKRGGGK
jgi:hypothetical protein